MSEWWPDWTKFPWWQLAMVSGVLVWFFRLASKTIDNLATDPLADKLASSVRWAARALLAAIAPPRNRRQYITLDPADMTWTGQGLVIGSGGQLGPLTVTATGTVGGTSTNPRA